MARVVHLEHHLLGPDLRIGEHRTQIGHAPARDAGGVEALDPVVDATRADALADQRVHGGAMLEARVVRRELRPRELGLEAEIPGLRARGVI